MLQYAHIGFITWHHFLNHTVEQLLAYIVLGITGYLKMTSSVWDVYDRRCACRGCYISSYRRVLEWVPGDTLAFLIISVVSFEDLLPSGIQLRYIVWALAVELCQLVSYQPSSHSPSSPLLGMSVSLSDLPSRCWSPADFPPSLTAHPIIQDLSGSALRCFQNLIGLSLPSLLQGYPDCQRIPLFMYLFGNRRERENEREISPLLRSPNAGTAWVWARLKPSRSSMWVQGSEYFHHPPQSSQAH